MRLPLQKFFRKKAINENIITSEQLPRHIAIVMDGNGRWAKHRGLPRTAGHHAGMVALRRTIRHANKLGIQVLTVYAFSTENWKRPSLEVDFLMRLPEEFLNTDLRELKENNVRVMVIGDRDGLPRHTRDAVQKAEQETAENTGMVLNFALNYGSRTELVHAIRHIAEKAAGGLLDINDIDEKTVSSHLFTAELPDPDLLIRPSGEIRLSNFLLWQLAYAELWFSDVYWPDFDREHLLEAIEAYQRRDRRYGGIKL